MSPTVTPQTGAPATLRAGLWMLGPVGSFSLMAVAERAVSSEPDTFEIIVYRSVGGLIGVLAYDEVAICS